MKCINIFVYDHQHYHIKIALSEYLFEKYKEYHLNNRILIGRDMIVDIHLNFDWWVCKLIVYEGFTPKSRFNIVYYLFTLKNNRY
ncbi:MAG: hypothetical protein Ta2E_00840 [Mycoplasmoidaceae bacterium]|nr:MAG: hypothetical protein Ta2E_00840 [Mycoplasmoidaceae bacterium]